LFGPLVSACVVVGDGDVVREWMKAGVKDSKAISSDSMILRLDKQIRATRGVAVRRMCLGMAKYNDLYTKFGKNLNRLLAWYHARSLEAALKEQPVPWGLLDQFTKQPLVQRALKEAPKGFELRMRTKAESDPVVAAASIVARAEYVRQMQALSEKAGEKLKKGASAEVKAQAKRLVEKFGPEALGDFAKLHFRTAYEALGLPAPEKKVWIRRDKGGATKSE
jgi:ribonuclease HIII